MSDDPASNEALKWEIRSSLVKRLGIPWEGMGEMANQQRGEAAVQIVTMMDEIEAWRQAAQKAERDIAQLRSERDEARREVCEFHHLTGFLSGDYAYSRGWDCFKKGDYEFSQSAKDFEVFLRGQDKIMLDMNDRLRAERDDARALYCGVLEAYKRGDGREEAKKRGWFCFKEQA